MKIGIEMRWVTPGSSGGIATLLKGVLQTLFARHPEHEYQVYCTVFNRALFDQVPQRVKVVSLPVSHYLAQLDRLAVDHGVDVLFHGYPLEEDLSFPLSRRVFLVPDLQHEFFPDFFTPRKLQGRRAAFARALGRAGAVGTISEFARQTLRAQPCTRCPDIFLMTPALSAEYRRAGAGDVTPAEQGLVPDGDFFLLPANLWPHKNHRRVLRAFARYLRQGTRPATLVLTGDPQGWPALRAEFPALPVRHLGFVRVGLLRRLYRRARALVFFSLFEGFGMPLLEAFDAGTPVVCSHTTSLPEVGGDAVLTCDPTDVAAMSALMRRVAGDAALRAELAARGRRRLAAYAWETSADNLLAACVRVHEASGKRPAPVPPAPLVVERPLVSIVTPSFNQGRFLKRTIDSVLGQTYPLIEYHVIDGGSTDESVAVLRSYGDRFGWVSEPDRGQTHAINKGFARSRGALRAYLNSDDVLVPDAVARAVDHFRRNPGWDMVYGAAEYIDEDDRVIGRYNTAPYSFARLMQDCCVCQPAAFWRSAVARKVGPFDESLQYAMDYDYWLRIDRAGGRIEHVADLLACSRLYAATKTRSARRQIFREIFRVCQAHGGYVHLNYFGGLWHHLCRESDTGPARWLHWLPEFEKWMARWHCRWWNRRHGRSAAAEAFSASGGPAAGPWQRWFGNRGARPPVVAGLWEDNWLEPTCKIRLQPAAAGRQVLLGGEVPVDMAVRVRSGKRRVGTFPLKAGRYERFCFSVAPDTDRLLLEFSKHVTDPARRRLSFWLQETNAFAERDLV
jgi:glycosyltransferase involved in cell wall biosynthesis